MMAKRTALKELIGILGVTFSLVFVGLEIRQNTAVARAEAYRDVAIFTTDLVTTMAGDREWLALYSRIRSGALRDDFSTEERMLVAFRLEALFRQAELVWRQVDNDVLPPTALDLLLAETLRLPYAREAWVASRPDMPGDFAEFMDQWLEVSR